MCVRCEVQGLPEETFLSCTRKGYYLLNGILKANVLKGVVFYRKPMVLLSIIIKHFLISIRKSGKVSLTQIYLHIVVNF